MRQKFGERTLKADPRLLVRLVENQFSLVQDERSRAELKRAGDMMRCENHDAAFLTVSLKGLLQEIYSAAVQNAVRFVQQQ